jgi:hypothetical protein
MEAVNESMKLIAKAIEILNNINVWADSDICNDQICQVKDLLKLTVDKLAT